MLRTVGKGALALGAGLLASIVVSIEVLLFAIWAFDRDPACQAQTSELCAFNFVAALGLSAIAGLVAGGGTLVATGLYLVGRRVDAKTVFAGLVALLAIGHIWLLI